LDANLRQYPDIRVEFDITMHLSISWLSALMQVSGLAVQRRGPPPQLRHQSIHQDHLYISVQKFVTRMRLIRARSLLFDGDLSMPI
jgi:transcriptional regulator GlxA family with amidase domain